MNQPVVYSCRASFFFNWSFGLLKVPNGTNITDRVRTLFLELYTKLIQAAASRCLSLPQWVTKKLAIIVLPCLDILWGSWFDGLAQWWHRWGTLPCRVSMSVDECRCRAFLFRCRWSMDCRLQRTRGLGPGIYNYIYIYLLTDFCLICMVFGPQITEPTTGKSVARDFVSTWYEMPKDS